MNSQTIPPAPDDVPDELCAEILDLDEVTLGKLQEWICASFPTKQEPLTEEELTNISTEVTNGTEILASISTEEQEEIDVAEMLGTFTWQFFQCSNEQCRCTSGRPAELHGPYLQRHYVDDSGHYASEYIPSVDIRHSIVEQVLSKPSP